MARRTSLLYRNASVAVLALGALTLAGCLGGPEQGGQERQDGDDAVSLLAFLPPVDLICPEDPHFTVTGVLRPGAHCGSFGEPQLEVAGDGTIWYSAVCCIGQSPPIWRSFDGGLTFEPMPFADGTGATRDAFGIEGDFAIDDAGNVYFFDISAATAYITKYTGAGDHVHTKADAFPPIVDRPWVRAGAEDQVFIAYNAGLREYFYRSDDGGLTWDLPGGMEFPCGLMALGQGPVRDHLIMGGCMENPAAWISLDGGRTWGERLDLPLPGNADATEAYMQPAADAAGTTYVPITHDAGPRGDNTAISVVAIEPDGEIRPLGTITPESGLVDKPWLVAGKQGVVALAYYAADNVTRNNEERKAVWHLKITYTTDGHAGTPTWTTVVADPAPVLEGTFGRNLGDFLQLRQTPDGDLVVAYAARPDGQELVNRFVRSAPGDLDFGPEVFRNG